MVDSTKYRKSFSLSLVPTKQRLVTFSVVEVPPCVNAKSINMYILYFTKPDKAFSTTDL